MRLMCEQRLFKNIRPCTDAMLRGLHAVVPVEVMACFATMASSTELTDLVGGLPHIDVDDWERNTRYTGGFTDKSQTILWFWQASPLVRLARTA